MRIDKLSLTNFRCFEHLEINLHDSFSLLLGDNGSGKTALLEAARIVIAAFVSGIEPFGPLEMEIDDIHEKIVPDNLGSVLEPPEYRYFEPAEIHAVGHIDGEQANWCISHIRKDNKFSEEPVTTQEMAEYFRYRGNGTSRVDISKIVQIAERLSTERNGNQNPILPILAYYPAQRTSATRTDPTVLAEPYGTWEKAYWLSLNSSLRQSEPMLWLRTLTYSELQQGLKSPLLASVLSALGQSLEGYIRIYWSVQLDELIAVDADGHQHRARLISEGYWTMLILMLDMAYRCALLNPHLGANVLSETPGVVLVDELDLHLHPRWQQRVVSDLRKTFPKVQFIATTHSPIIAASLPSECLYHLERDEEGNYSARQYPEKTLGLSPDQMLTGSYFDLVSNRPKEVQEHLSNLAQSVSAGNPDAAIEFLRVLNNGMEPSNAK